MNIILELDLKSFGSTIDGFLSNFSFSASLVSQVEGTSAWSGLGVCYVGFCICGCVCDDVM